ncbi:MAG: hypothetical protein Unbinned2851contig1000_34 [Prokaryotic dsDNA virus sp.]|nr:MAG: hypothetical protein Unbinned2851contig1000_34 [Prokaryotic dsDNA virus sp.]
MKLNTNHKQAIQLMILDRWVPSKTTNNVANHLGVAPQTVALWRTDKDFCEEFKRQLDIYRKNFDDVQLADRKERVKELQRLYVKIPDKRIALKIKVLDTIAREMGDVQTHVHKHMLERADNQDGVNAPPQANTYEEWVEQNRQMEEMMKLTEAKPVEAEVTTEDVVEN